MDSYQKNDPIDPMFGVIHVYLLATTFDKFTFQQILIVSGKKRKISNQKLLASWKKFDPREIRFLSLSVPGFHEGKIEKLLESPVILDHLASDL